MIDLFLSYRGVTKKGCMLQQIRQSFKCVIQGDAHVFAPENDDFLYCFQQSPSIKIILNVF